MQRSVLFALGLQSIDAVKRSKCPFGYTSEDSALLQTGEEDVSKYLYPKEMPGFQGGEDAVRVPKGAAAEDLYKKIAKKVWAAHDALPEEGRHRHDYIGCLLRTAGHDFMDFRYEADAQGNFVSASGGSDGCINFKDPDNKGVPQCLTKFKVGDIYQSVKSEVTLADFFVIMGEAIAARAATDFSHDKAWQSSTLEARFLQQFKFGRVTAHECADADGLMPNPEEGCADLKRVFLDHIYLNSDIETSWKRLTAISGVHTIGGMQEKNSGYEGLWTSTPAVFNNEYYILMLTKGWGPKRNILGRKNKNAWKIIDKSGTDKDNAFYEKFKNILYLNTDMCLAYNNNFDTVASKALFQPQKDPVKNGLMILDNPKVVWSQAQAREMFYRGNLLNAKNRNCCAWFSEKDLLGNEQQYRFRGDLSKHYWNKNLDMDYCGLKFDEETLKKGKFNQAMIRKQCCGGLEGWDPQNRWAETQPQNCEYHGEVRGPAIEYVLLYANDEEAWLSDYLEAWKVATDNVLTYTQKQWKAKKYFRKNYEKYPGGEEGKELLQCDGIDWCGKKAQRKLGIKVPGFRPFQRGFFSKSIGPANEGWREHVCLMEENTYDPAFWAARAEGHGHSCYGTQFTELRAPYDNVAATARIEHYADADPDWEDAVGEFPKLPSAERARKYYADWAAKDSAWRAKWENDPNAE